MTLGRLTSYLQNCANAENLLNNLNWYFKSIPNWAYILIFKSCHPPNMHWNIYIQRMWIIDEYQKAGGTSTKSFATSKAVTISSDSGDCKIATQLFNTPNNYSTVNITVHSYTNSRDHRYTGAATTIHWLSFGFQRPHRSPFKLNWIRLSYHWMKLVSTQ